MTLTFSLLAPRDVPGFAAREIIAPADEPAPAAPLREPPVTRDATIAGIRQETLTFRQQPFDVGVTTIRNALVLPRPPRSDLRDTVTEDGVLRYDGDHIILSLDGFTCPDLLFRSHGIPRRFALAEDRRSLTTDAPLPHALDHVHAETIFLGDFHDHFGHILVESLNRLWYLAELSPVAIRHARFLLLGSWSDPDKPSLLWELLALFGIQRSQVIVAEGPLRFDRLVVPSPAARPFIGWDIYFSRTMERAYADLSSRLASRARIDALPGRKLYFPRPAAGRRRLLSAPHVEEQFRAQGYAIVRPESFSFPDQVAMARSAEAIAGPAGSAMHLAAFAPYLKRLDVLASDAFFVPIADVQFTMYKGAGQNGASVRYFFGNTLAPTGDGIDADWDIDRDGFDAWLTGQAAS